MNTIPALPPSADDGPETFAQASREGSARTAWGGDKTLKANTPESILARNRPNICIV